MVQALAWVLMAVLSLFQEIGLPFESIALPLGLIFGWALFQQLNVLCVHAITIRWVRVPLLLGLLLPNIAICLMPAMMLSGSLNDVRPSVVVLSNPILLTLLTALILLCHGAATLFLAAPDRFAQLTHRLPILGPRLQRSAWFFPQEGVKHDTPSSGLPYNPSVATDSASELVGLEAILQSALRPWGKLRLDGGTYEVKSEGCFIEAGTLVRVARIEGGYIVVVPAEED